KATSFQCADLTGAVFWGADLDRADFHRAYVYKTDFRQSILTNADFSNAVVLYPKLDGADLTGANFSAADFTYLNDNEKDELIRLLESRGAKVKNPGAVANTNPHKGSAEDWQTKLYALLRHLTADTTGDPPAKTKLIEYLYGQIDYEHKIRYLS